MNEATSPLAEPPAPLDVATLDPSRQTAHMVEDRANLGMERVLAADTQAPPNLSDYRIDYHGAEIDEEQRQADLQLRGWMRDLALPADAGTALAKSANEYLARSTDWDDATKAVEARRTEALLGKVWKERAPELLGLARQLVRDLDKRHNGEVSRWLNETGLGNSAEFVVQMGHHAERLKLAKEAKQ